MNNDLHWQRSSVQKQLSLNGSSRGMAAEDRGRDCRDPATRAGYLPPREILLRVAPSLSCSQRDQEALQDIRTARARAGASVPVLFSIWKCPFYKTSCCTCICGADHPWRSQRTSLPWRQNKPGRKWQRGEVTSWSVGKEKESPGLWVWHLPWALNSLEKTF